MYALFVAIMVVALCGGVAFGKPTVSQRQREAIHIYNQGVAAVVAGNHRQGAELFKKAIELDPTQPDFYYNLGSAFSRLNKYEDAEAALTKAISFKPNEFDYLEQYAVVLHLEHKYSQAKAAYKKAAKYMTNAEQRRLYTKNWNELVEDEHKNGRKIPLPRNSQRDGSDSHSKGSSEPTR